MNYHILLVFTEYKNWTYALNHPNKRKYVYLTCLECTLSTMEMFATKTNSVALCKLTVCPLQDEHAPKRKGYTQYLVELTLPVNKLYIRDRASGNLLRRSLAQQLRICLSIPVTRMKRFLRIDQFQDFVCYTVYCT